MVISFFCLILTKQKEKINKNTNPKYKKYKEITHTIKVLLS